MPPLLSSGAVIGLQEIIADGLTALEEVTAQCIVGRTGCRTDPRRLHYSVRTTRLSYYTVICLL